MEEGYILLSWLGDFDFCPHSIYLHGLYSDSSKELFQRKAQWLGTIAHESLDQHRYSCRKDELTALPVSSEKLQLYGKIDLYKGKFKELIERKKKIKFLYQSYIYQLWGQYYCMTDMGYIIDTLSLYSLDDNKKYKVPLPNEKQYEEFCDYLL